MTNEKLLSPAGNIFCRLEMSLFSRFAQSSKINMGGMSEKGSERVL